MVSDSSFERGLLCKAQINQREERKRKAQEQKKTQGDFCLRQKDLGRVDEDMTRSDNRQRGR